MALGCPGAATRMAPECPSKPYVKRKRPLFGRGHFHGLACGIRSSHRGVEAGSGKQSTFGRLRRKGRGAVRVRVGGMAHVLVAFPASSGERRLAVLLKVDFEGRTAKFDPPRSAERGIGTEFDDLLPPGGPKGQKSGARLATATAATADCLLPSPGSSNYWLSRSLTPR